MGKQPAKKQWKVRLSFVTPDGSRVDIFSDKRGKRAEYDFVPGALLLMVASHGHADYRAMSRKKRAAMEACLDVLWPKWRDEQAKAGGR